MGDGCVRERKWGEITRGTRKERGGRGMEAEAQS